MIALLMVAAAAVHDRYDAVGAHRAAQMLAEMIRFGTVAGNGAAHAAQKEWLVRTAGSLGLSTRDVGKVMGLSGERVRLIEREALRKLRNSEIINAAGWI